MLIIPDPQKYANPRLVDPNYDPIRPDEIVLAVVSETTLERSSPRQVTKLLVATTPDEVMKALSAELSELRAKLQKERIEHAKLAEENIKTSRQLANVRVVLADTEEALKLSSESAGRLREANQKLEADLGKLCAHFGEKAIKEALS